MLLGCGGGGGSSTPVTPEVNTTQPDVNTTQPDTNTTQLDTTPPVITLHGDNPQILTYDEAYIEAGASAVDEVDGLVTVTIEGLVVSDTAGTYTRTYTATDHAGNIAVATRTVKVEAPNIPIGVKKTGQIEVFVAHDDGDYQKGLEPYYTRDDATNIVTDNSTYLQWEDDANVSDRTKLKNFSEATEYCTNLTLGGYTNWRVPNIKELMYIANRGRSNPAIDDSVFTSVGIGSGTFYWSATPEIANTNNMWAVQFSFGDNKPLFNGLNLFVRCVRSGQ
jgi:hypothetical protein